MSDKPIEMRVQVLPWDDVISAVETLPVPTDEGTDDPLWIAVDEILKGVPIAKH